ncbi:MAG: hypothetical protein ACKVHU_11985 [Acidimicrobiales bacterium]|jgi:hypothetical protein
MAETLNEVMNELESLGTAQNRKVYLRHGASRRPSVIDQTGCATS